MTSRTWRYLANSSIQGPIEKRKPTTFRVIMKSRSGYLINEEDDKKSQASVRDKRNKTQMSFMKQDIKDYVKSMRRTKAQISNPQANMRPKTLNNEESLKKQREKERQSLSQSRTSEFRGGSAPKHPQLPTKQLQRRIDQLIKLKLQYIQELQQIQRGNWRYHGLGQTKEERKLENIRKIQSVDKEIQVFVESIKERVGNEDQNQKLEDINRKIGIIQKVMAEGMTQSEIAKKGYYKFVNKYKPKTPNLKIYNHNMQKIRSDTDNMLHKSLSAAINLQSTNQQSYKAPDKKSYAIKPQRAGYQFKNQPLHRSTYNREYLIYGSVPSYPYKESCSNIMPSYSPSKLRSLYSSQFTGKPAERINFRELDCYRDKFKNIDIPFITNRVEPKSKQNQQQKRVQKEAKNRNSVNDNNAGRATIASVRNPVDGRTVRYNTQHYIQNLSTESQNKFTGEENEIRSTIKHKNLYKLKYAYKATAHG